jgi:hypothetical protein
VRALSYYAVRHHLTSKETSRSNYAPPQRRRYRARNLQWGDRGARHSSRSDWHTRRGVPIPRHR